MAENEEKGASSITITDLQEQDSVDVDIKFLTRTIELANESVKGGNHPFGSLVVGPDGMTILGEAMNSHSIDKGPGHAETNVCRDVAKRFPLDLLRQSTLYTSVERKLISVSVSILERSSYTSLSHQCPAVHAFQQTINQTIKKQKKLVVCVRVRFIGPK